MFMTLYCIVYCFDLFLNVCMMLNERKQLLNMNLNLSFDLAMYPS